MVTLDKIKTTFSEYAALPESNQIIELIDGEIIVTPPKDLHQKIIGQIYFVIRSLMKSGELRFAPTGLYIDAFNSFEPDLFWISPDNAQCVLDEDDRFWHGAPDVIVEILSPSTSFKDRGKKYTAYETLGVREYWLVDPAAKTVEMYRLTDGAYGRLEIFALGDKFASAVLGSDIDVASLFP